MSYLSHPQLLYGGNRFTNTYAMQFGGTNQYLYRLVADFRGGDSAGAFSCWAKTTFNSGVLGSTLFCSADEATATRYIVAYIFNGMVHLDQRNNDTPVTSIRGNTVITDGNPHNIIISTNGTSYTIDIDNVAETITVISGTNNGDWFADTANRDNLCIGAFRRNTTVSYFNGTLDEAAFYSAGLTAGQKTQIYNGGNPGDLSPLNPVFWIRADEPADDMTGGTGIITDIIGAQNMTPQNTVSGDKVLW